MESSSSSSSSSSGAAAEAAAARACTPAAERSLSDRVVDSSSSSSRDPGAAAEADAARTAAGVAAAFFSFKPGTGLKAKPPTACELSAPFATVMAPTAAAVPPDRTDFLASGVAVAVASEERFGPAAAAATAAAGATVLFPILVAAFAEGTAGLLASDRRDLGAAAAASAAEACSDFSLARARALAGSGEARAIAGAAAPAVVGLANAVDFGAANEEARTSDGRAVAAPVDAGTADAAALGEAVGARVSVGLVTELGACSALDFRACGLGCGVASDDAAGEGAAAFAGVAEAAAAGLTGVAAGIRDCRTGMPDAGRGNLLAL